MTTGQQYFQSDLVQLNDIHIRSLQDAEVSDVSRLECFRGLLNINSRQEVFHSRA